MAERGYEREREYVMMGKCEKERDRVTKREHEKKECGKYIESVTKRWQEEERSVTNNVYGKKRTR